MTDLNQNTFSSFNVFPKYVTDDTLKRARVDNNGLTSIRVSSASEPTPTDLSTLESNTGDIKTADQAISTAVGTSTDTSSDSTVIGLLKSIASKLQ